MTTQEIAGIYAELETISVTTPLQPQLGFTYYADRVREGRAAQDRLGDLLIAVHKDTARVRVKTRALKEIARLSGSVNEERTHETLAQLASEADDLKYVTTSLTIKAQLVRQSILDIRLLIQIMETQVRLGEVAPASKTANPHGEVSRAGTSEGDMMVERFLNSDVRGIPSAQKH